MINEGPPGGWSPAPCHLGPSPQEPLLSLGSSGCLDNSLLPPPLGELSCGAGRDSTLLWPYLMDSSMSLKDRSTSSNLLRASWAAGGGKVGDKVRGTII